jgi:EamA domain-containing membrane protein RarD
MNDMNRQPTPNRPQLTSFTFIHLGVCLSAVIYYILKLSGTRLLTRGGEFTLDTILIVVVAINFIITLNKKNQGKNDNREGA